MTRGETEASPPGHFGRTCLLEESFDEGECGVGDVGPAVVEDQGVSAALDFDVFGGFGILELLFVAAVGECPGGGGVLGARDDQQWPPVGVLDVDAGVPAKHEVGETGLNRGVLRTPVRGRCRRAGGPRPRRGCWPSRTGTARTLKRWPCDGWPDCATP